MMAIMLYSAACCLVAALTLSACGYQMAGMSTLPGDAQTIGIKMLTNRSIETGAEAVVTNALADELNRRRPGTVKQVDRADAVLTGTIDAIRRKTISREGTLTALQERITVWISLTLTSPSGGVVWERRKLTAEEDYDVVTGNNAATEGNRRQAFAKA